MQNPRQMYGLGSLVKKAARGIKKIVKSPIGKAALIGGLGFGIPGTDFKGLMGTNFMKNALMKGKPVSGEGAGWLRNLGTYLNPWSGAFGTKGPGVFNPKHAFGLLGATAVAAPFVQKALGWGPYQEEEVEEEDWTEIPSSILNLRNQARDYYTAATPDYVGSPFMPQKQYVMPNFYAAEGGRAGLLNGGGAGEAQIEQMLRAEYLKYKNKGGTMPYEQFKILVMKQAQQGQMPNQMMAADGGRAGYRFGRNVERDPVVEEIQITGDDPAEFEDIKNQLNVSPMVSAPHPDEAWMGLWEKYFEIVPPEIKTLPDFKDWFRSQDFDEDLAQWGIQEDVQFAAQGGRIGAQEGGLMDLGGQEKDYRDEGGFVALGGEERADDVPARLSKNEFVFTADAVRNAGGGDIDRGSEVMQNLMDNLEAGGEVSEDSQGLEGGEEIMSEEMVEDINPAQRMYDNYEQLQSRVA